MKKTIAFLLALLLLTGCAARQEGTGVGMDSSPASAVPDSGGAHSIHYELGALRDDFTITPESAAAGVRVEIRTNVLIDADLHVYLDGLEIEKSHFDSDYWGYSFPMPNKDVVVTAKPYSKAEIWGAVVADKGFAWNVRYIRTDGCLDGEKYPKLFWISSAEELEAYYAANRDRYQLDGSDFTAARADCDAAFFAQYDLLIILLEEGSGSVRHEVTGVRISSSQSRGKQFLLQPEINRITPEVGTCDMAEWHILIEVPKDRGAAFSELGAPVFTLITR